MKVSATDVVPKIRGEARKVHAKILTRKTPSLRFPVRSLSNVIYRSGNAAHMNEFFCVPQARFLGVTPQDIIDYDLPTHPLKDVDIKRAKDALKNDPFVQHHKPWQEALERQIQMGVRVEQ